MLVPSGYPVARFAVDVGERFLVSGMAKHRECFF